MNRKKIVVKQYPNTIKCAICHTDITDLSKVYQPQDQLGVICAECCQKFSDQDIVVILSLFVIYGGYFGKCEKQHFSLSEELQKTIIEGRELKDKEQIEEFNSYLLYRALIHGIGPDEFVKMLTSLLQNKEYGYFL